jgi:hypothetical protein
VLTQGMGHNFIMSFFFRDIREERPFNISILYKIGALSLNNKRMDEDPGDQQKTDFLSNIAVITGIGAGLTHRIGPKIHLALEAQLNRSSDTVEDVYKVYKNFYDSPNTVNHYALITTGIIYEIHFSGKKKADKSRAPFAGGN